MTRRRLPVLLIILVGALLPAQAYAQVSLLGATGLGRRLTPIDARARAMGNVGVALHGGNLSAVNPAAAARFAGSGLWATFLPESRTVTGESANGDISTEDVPIIRLVLPWGGRWAAGISAGAYLNQDWGVQFIDSLTTSTGEVAFQETRTSDGGVTQFRLDFAGVMAENLSLGASFLYYSGEARRSVERLFEANAGWAPHEASTALDYKGWGLAFGAEYQPIPEMILGAVASWGAGLTIENDTTEQSLDIGLPLTLDVGGSWQLTPDFLLALALGWEGWSTVADDLPNAAAADVWRAGLGVELTAIGGQTSQLLFRGGAHTERLPFEIGESAVWERALSLGLGLNLREGRARLDGSIEFGKRGSADDNDVEESYTRFAFGLAVFTR
ncbi:MAG: hypothetical protein PVJ43_15525 [Gemmatimonadales bacterium]|jgi:hypothetical protein